MKSIDTLREAPFPLFRVALVEPEIPQNTGNIGRTCVGTRSELHLVGKLGFEITDSQVKRAGLDYWPNLSLTMHSSLQDWQGQVQNPERVFYFSTHAEKTYFEVDYQPGDWFVFGKETKGLDKELLRQNWDRVVKIPVLGPIRSFNLATAVAIVLYEGIRQVQAKNK
jgi:tRNA (cytidine/uridine-2'-O-)-methyltransferase